ncbi:MAG: hypothetical protein IJ740_08040 [Ruminococcus sp.]|nr:hypothetical protein [Ruminococcus sp.]
MYIAIRLITLTTAVLIFEGSGRQVLSASYFAALIIMIVGTALVAADTLGRKHTHEHTHNFTHTHNGSTHTHRHKHWLFLSDDKHGHRHALAELEKYHTSHI